MKTRMLYLVMIVLVAFSASSIAEAMTAGEVIENIIASYEKQMKGVEDFTIVTDRGATYHKRTTVEGRSAYKIRSETEMMVRRFTTVYDGVYNWFVNPLTGKPEKEKLDYDPYQLWKNLKADEVIYGGTEELDGRKTYILKFEDFSNLMKIPELGETVIEEKVGGRIWIDAKDWILRKIEVDMEWKDEQGKKRTGKTVISMKDYRKIDGMHIPFLTEITFPGILTPEEELEIRQRLKEMKEKLEKMSPMERRMVESMMGPQIKMAEDMLKSRSFTTKVLQVKINTGLSDDLFDGSKLK